MQTLHSPKKSNVSSKEAQFSNDDAINDEDDDDAKDEQLLRSALLAALSDIPQIGFAAKDGRGNDAAAGCNGGRISPSSPTSPSLRDGRGTADATDATADATADAGIPEDAFSPIDEGDSELLFSSYSNPLPQNFRFSFPGFGHLRTRVWTPISEEGSSDLERENESTRGFSRETTPPTFALSASTATPLPIPAPFFDPKMTVTTPRSPFSTAKPESTPSRLGLVKNGLSSSETNDGNQSDAADEAVVRGNDADEGPNVSDVGGGGGDGDHGTGKFEDAKCEVDHDSEEKGMERNNSGTSQTSIDSGIGDTDICVV